MNFVETILHRDPKISVIENLLSEEECDHIIKIGSPNLVNSVVSDEKGGYVSSGRTSKTSWIHHYHDEITLEIGRRISKTVSMPLENAEKFQLVHYGETNEYRSHYDSWDHNGSEKTLRCIKYGGPRIITALIYLNNVKEGGSTRFTKLNIDVQPQKGKLLIFENTQKNSIDKHILSEHAGMPVKEGEKYICNLWFRHANTAKLYSETHPEYYEKYKIPIQVKNTKILETREQQKYVANPEINSYLEVGDYFPFVSLKFSNNVTKHIHNYVDNNEFVVIHCKDISMIKNMNIHPDFHHMIFFAEGEPNNEIKHISCNDKQIYSLFQEHDDICIYLMTPNRKIYKHYKIKGMNEFKTLNIENKMVSSSQVPFLMIENVLSPELLSTIDFFYKQNSNRLITHEHAGKNRHHLHPNKDLEIMIDNKLSRSVFPEIMKIFYFDVKYRENYKICHYNAETGGRFHPHRDTPHPYQHRRFAMTLFLNDDYKGGEFELPEYNFKIKPKANSALIFPGISSHKVNQVSKGTRKVIITFFCNEIEGDKQRNTMYSVKSNFFRDHQIQYSDIYPI